MICPLFENVLTFYGLRTIIFAGAVNFRKTCRLNTTSIITTRKSSLRWFLYNYFLDLIQPKHQTVVWHKPNAAGGCYFAHCQFSYLRRPPRIYLCIQCVIGMSRQATGVVWEYQRVNCSHQTEHGQKLQSIMLSILKVILKVSNYVDVYYYLSTSDVVAAQYL